MSLDEEDKLSILYGILDRAVALARLGGLEDHARKCGCDHYVSELIPIKTEVFSYKDLLVAAELVHNALDRWSQHLKETSVLPEDQPRDVHAAEDNEQGPRADS